MVKDSPVVSGIPSIEVDRLLPVRTVAPHGVTDQS
jgi:hypothetical protein